MHAYETDAYSRGLDNADDIAFMADSKRKLQDLQERIIKENMKRRLSTAKRQKYGHQ